MDRLRLFFLTQSWLREKLAVPDFVIRIEVEASASTLASLLVDGRPAVGDPSLHRCWGRWTQKAALDVRVVGESRSVELKEHFDELGTIEVLCLG